MKKWLLVLCYLMLLEKKKNTPLNLTFNVNVMNVKVTPFIKNL